MALLGMKQMNTVRNLRGRTLDLLFVNEDATRECTVSEAHEALIGADPHHPPLLATINCPPLVHYEEPLDVSEFNFRKADFQALNLSIRDTDWTPLYETTDIDEAVEFFTSTLKQLFRHHVPRPKHHQKPLWSNRQLREMKRKRAAALRAYTNNRNPISKREFTVASNRYRNYNRVLYSNHVQQTQDDLKRNPKRFWSFVNGKRKESGIPSTMFLREESSSCHLDSCNLFANHFSSVFKTDSPTTQQIRNALRGVPRDVIEIGNVSFTEADIMEAIGKLKPSSSAGPDGVPPIVFKKCAASLWAPLMAICNMSLSQSKFPDKWKRSVMFPVFKKGDKRDVLNYRGITSLCAGSKLLEILVGKVIFSETKAYISPDQHGFFPGRSINSNLVEFTSHCLRNIEDGTQVDTVYTDLKAAFDRVDHQLLLAKIGHLGALPNFVRWLESYLVSRRLSVKIGSVESYCFCNRSGVPQGSNLGPLLFSLFFNDVCFVIPVGCRLLYADDLKIFLIIRSIEDCKMLQRLIDLFVDWCTRNHLSISINKCSVITFTRKKSPLLWTYQIAGCLMERVSVIKDLGVLLDSQMSFREHYSTIIAKANRNLGFIFRLAREFRDPYCLRSLYYSLVRSTLESAAIVWSPYQDIWIKRIEAVQSKFIKYALRFLPWNNPIELPPYADRCRLLGMDTLAKRRNISKAMFVGNVLKGNIDSPSILSKININTGLRLIRSRDFLRLDFRRTDYGKNEPIRSMCFMFNQIYAIFDFSLSAEVLRNRLSHSNCI